MTECSEKESHIKIKNFLSKENKHDISKALDFFIDELDRFLEIEKSSKDVRSFILISYVIVPSLTLDLFREIMLYFFKRKGINEQALRKGQWLPEDLLLKSKLCKEILITQGSCFKEIIENKSYFEAIDFFCDKNKSIHRNKVAHNFCSSLKSVSQITLTDIEKQSIYILKFLADLIDVV